MIDGSASVTIAKRIQRSTGMTFHVATRFLPERVRYPTYVLYAYFRLADQIVDDPDPRPPAEQEAMLTAFEEGALGAREPEHPVVAAMAPLVDQHEIDPSDVEAFIAAMKRDIDAPEYDTFTDLEAYLRGSAVAVAYMMLAVMDPADPDAAKPHARALGEAFQLTNFLRDVREDIIEFDRLYLPLETLDEQGITASDVRSLTFTPGFARAIQDELARTEERYRKGVAGIGMLPADCQFPVLLAAVLYAEHHRMIEAVDYDVLHHRPSFGRWQYPWVVIRTYLAWKRYGDPETVFYAVSPVEPPVEWSISRRRPVTRLRRFVRLIKTQVSFGRGE